MADGSVDLSSPLAIHLVGIGGAGISAIGVILSTMGHRVTGVDVNETKAWPSLTSAGIDPRVVEAGDLFASAIDAGAELVAHSTAFPPTDADRELAVSKGVRIVDRAGILAAICSQRRTVAVSGTHGKTSTTAMLATLLAGVGADPSFLIGAVPPSLGAAARWGGPDGVFVVEADESDGSFLELGASTAVVTNIDEDHLGFWGDIEAIETAFDRFVAEATTSVVCVDDPGGSGLAEQRANRVAAGNDSVTVGEASEARYRVRDVVVDRLATTFELDVDGSSIGTVRIGTPGRHHARNAATAIAAAATTGVDPRAAADALAAYTGVARRFEVRGSAAGVTVVDDYAHNPGKVRALVSSAVEAGWGRVLVVFQPQRWTRTRDQWRDFGAALTGADLVAVTEVYGAGEPPVEGITGRLILAALLEKRPWASTAWTPTLDDAERWVLANVRPDDLVLTVGAGDVHVLAGRLVDALTARVAAGRPG
ncbi:MAG: UDP-N-acetylmuramate--L-alanine ligase [Acidimicrobiales bacterium]|nr:UDP-N-acetylmuramate--L-alanine ligase [Acidimicrobiales bacterium]